MDDWACFKYVDMLKNSFLNLPHSTYYTHINWNRRNSFQRIDRTCKINNEKCEEKKKHLKNVVYDICMYKAYDWNW